MSNIRNILRLLKFGSKKKAEPELGQKVKALYRQSRSFSYLNMFRKQEIAYKGTGLLDSQSDYWTVYLCNRIFNITYRLRRQHKAHCYRQ